ncbi:serine protease [Streptomyces sp. NBC_01351]|uniref:serine protease n=1 Tax=Streptomyces sp. NBC_01351 TaxID=2903833 RepID=UPI002E364D65|nr:serine protease [Streptomyces sp. NBC_01351]
MAELVTICDQAGRVRGSGFVADDRGTVLTSHDAVDGLTRMVVRGPTGRTWPAGAQDVTSLRGTALAAVRTDGLGLRPLPVTTREVIEQGTYVRVPARGWRQARVLGLRALVVELAIGTDGRDALRQGGEACGGPVLDAETGAVLAVLAGGSAVALRAAAAADPGGPLAALLDRNAATVPAYGADLNLAGALQLTGTTLGPAVALDESEPPPVDRPAIAAELDAFASGNRLVLALAGHPGTGRTTALAALAARRSRGPRPAPTLWLRGADLRAPDTSLADAVTRALAEATRIAAADAQPCAAAGSGGDGGVPGRPRSASNATMARPSDPWKGSTPQETPRRVPGTAGTTPTPPSPPPATPDGTGTGIAEAVARVAAGAGRGLLVVLDAPEEMPPGLAHRLAPWTEATTAWLRAVGARLVVAARTEYWEVAGALHPPEVVHTPARPARRLRPALALGDLTPAEAETARARLGIPVDAVREADARHPLTLRLLAGVRAAGVTAGRPGRDEVFAAHLDLVALRVAVRIAAAAGGAHGRGVRRLAARVAGRVHEAARRCLGPGQGQLDRAAFEELFPWRTGWASAVLTEGLLVPAGPGYRFAHEELSDWLQGAHLDVPAALRSLVHAPAGQGLPVPRHRIGPVLEALHRLPSDSLRTELTRLVEALNTFTEHPSAPPGPAGSAGSVGSVGSVGSTGQTVPSGVAGSGLGWVGVVPAVPGTRRGVSWGVEPFQGSEGRAMVAFDALRGRPGTPPSPPEPASGAPEAAQDGVGSPGPAALDARGAGEGAASGRPEWWAGRLVREVLLRAPDAHPYLPVLHALAEHVARAGPGEFGGWFWNRLRLPEAERLDLLRRLLPADPAEAVPGDRFLDAAARRLARDPQLVQPLLCAWFTDGRRLRGRPGATVAGAAQALLHTHRRLALDDLTEHLVTAAHPRADELLAVLAEEEPSAMCRAVDRWAHDERPGRRVAAAAYGLATAAHVRTPADRELLRYAAQALLARPADATLHGSALATLLRDPQTRGRYLQDALDCFGDPERGSRLPASALVAALPVLPEPDAVFDALRARADGEVVRALAALATPGLARRAAELVREHLARRPEDAPHAAAFVQLRLEQGPVAGPVVRPLVLDLLRTAPTGVRAELAAVLAAPGGEPSYALRGELVDVLLREEADPRVLDAFLGSLAAGAAARPEDRTRELLRRTGRQLLRAPGGAAVFDRRTVELARTAPAFGAVVGRWLAQAGAEAAALLGPSARRTVETLGRAAQDVT